MGPVRAAELFRQRYPDAARYRITLYGSLAATGKGHMTDAAVTAVLAPTPVDFTWRPEEELPLHPNGMICEALDSNRNIVGALRVYSPGGGAIQVEGEPDPHPEVYAMHSMQDILRSCTQSGQTLSSAISSLPRAPWTAPHLPAIRMAVTGYLSMKWSG
jgi:L-serine dehydratase